MDDSISWAVEIVTNVVGAADATAQVRALQAALGAMAEGSVAGTKQFREFNQVVKQFDAVIKASTSGLASNAAAMRALGRDADTLTKNAVTMSAAFKGIRGDSLVGLVEQLDAAKSAAKGFGGEMAAVLQQYEGLSHQQAAMAHLNSTPFLGAGRLTNGTSGAMLDEQNRLDGLSRAAASDAIRRQMEGRGASTASSGALNDSAIADEARATAEASAQLRADLEANAAVAVRSAEIMSKSQGVAISGIRQTVAEAQALGRAYSATAQALRENGKQDNLAKQYEEKARAVADLVKELEAAQRVSSISRLDRAAVPALSPAAGKIGSEGLTQAASALGLVTTEANTATEANTRLAGALARVREAMRGEAADATKVGESMALANGALSKRNGLGNFYPLIVASGLFAGLSRGALGFAAASVKTAADYEQAFASVARTTSTNGHDAQLQIEAIKKSLVDLSAQMPVSFQDLSKVATAGNQLGIPAGNIADFTKVVSEFSAVTRTSADETAKSLGSLVQILHLSASEYSNLASSVTLVGRKSVATEPEVLAMTTKIGAIATVAGFSAPQIVGLAAALSSLREPVERSQGALVTYTKVVDNAASAGGAKFERFAHILGTTSDKAQALLRTNPFQFFKQFLGGLSSLDAVSQNTTLSSLGLGNVRVSEVLGRLANNMTVVNQTQADANSGYKVGADLSEQYAKATATLAAKFTELQNAVSNLFATLGASGLAPELALVVSFLKDVVTGLNDFLQKSAGIANAIVIFAAVAGVLALMRGAMIAAAIAAYALENAQLRVGAADTVRNLGSIINLMFNLKSATVAATAETNAMAVGQEALAAKTEATSVSLRAAGLAARFFGSTLGSALLVGAGLVAITAIIGQIQQHQSDLHDSFNNVELGSAIEKDTEAWKKGKGAIQTYAEATVVAKTQSQPWVADLQKAIGIEADLTDKTTKHTEAIKNNTLAYGPNAKAAIQKALVDNPDLQGLFSGGSLNTLKGTGFKFDQFIEAILGDPKKGASRYIDKIEKGLKRSPLDFTPGSLKTGPQIKELEKFREVTDASSQSLEENLRKQAYANAIQKIGADSTKEIADQTYVYGVTLSQVSDLLTKVTAKQNANIQNINTITGAVFSGVNAYFAQSSALQQMGQDFVNTGASAAFAGQGMQSVVDATAKAAGGDQQKTADGLQEIVNAMVAAGYVAGPYAKQLEYVNSVINILGGSADKKKADITFFAKGIADAQKSAATGSTVMKTAAQKAADALDKQAEAAQNAATKASDLAAKAQDAAAAFRTTKDYASDLGTVLQGAFDIQFAPQQASDAIATAFNDLRKNATDATAKIRDAREQIKGINADIAVLQADNLQQGYFLGIANAFGDRIGAASIQAQMAKNRQDIADKQSSKKDQYKSIDESFSQLDTATVGNSDAAIRNRAALTGLVGNYQDLITKLAASGLNQKELTKKVNEARANFIAQGEALGYSKRQLEPYSKALEGFNQIIAKIPRKVSVEVRSDVSPAQNALNEFYAKLKLDNAAKAAEAAAKFKEKYAQGIQKAAQEARKKADAELSKIGQGLSYHIPSANALTPAVRDSLQYTADAQRIASLTELEKQQARAGNISSALAIDNEVAALMLDMKQLRRNLGIKGVGGQFSSGGYTGAGGVYEPAGLVHKGEYVLPKYMVNQQTGMPYADALGRLVAGTRPQSGYAGGGYVNPEVMVVEPGPVFKRELRAIVQSEIAAVIEPKAIAGANQDYLSHSRRRGSTR